MSDVKYVFVQGGNRIELRNGDAELPYGAASEIHEALAVFRITASHTGITIETVNSLKDVIFYPKGSNSNV